MARGGRCRQNGCDGTYLGNNRCTRVECVQNLLSQKRTPQRDAENQAARAARLQRHAPEPSAREDSRSADSAAPGSAASARTAAYAAAPPEQPLVEMNPYKLLAAQAAATAATAAASSGPPPPWRQPAPEQTPRVRATSYECTWVMIKGIHEIADILTETSAKVRKVGNLLAADMALIDDNDNFDFE